MSSPASRRVMDSNRAAALGHRLDGRLCAGLAAKLRMEDSFGPFSIMAYCWPIAAANQPNFLGSRGHSIVKGVCTTFGGVCVAPKSAAASRTGGSGADQGADQGRRE